MSHIGVSESTEQKFILLLGPDTAKEGGLYPERGVAIKDMDDPDLCSNSHMF